MRQKTTSRGRVSNKLKAALLTLVAIFAISGIGVSQASAAQQVSMTFNDAWIKLPSMQALLGSLHAIDPADGKGVTVNLKGDLDPATGKVSYKASEFNFPRQSFEVLPGKSLNLDIAATQDFGGTFDPKTGAGTAQLPLKLVVDSEALSLKCEAQPLNIALDTAAASADFNLKDGPVVTKSSAIFAPPSGAGAMLGNWTGVTIANNVTGVAAYGKDEAAMTTACKTLLAALLGGGNPNTPLDGTIWLGGTATVISAPAQVGKITAPKKGKVKKGKATVIKVKVSNTGDATLTGKLAVKSSNKQVKAPKSVKLNVAAGATRTVKVRVKAKKKAKGKAKITFTAGGKKAVTTLTVKK